jgi:hypothetical protein
MKSLFRCFYKEKKFIQVGAQLEEKQRVKPKKKPGK